MSKLLSWLFLVTLILGNLTFPKEALAVPTCKQEGIEWQPTYFPENQTSIDLKFTVKDPNKVNFLRGKNARLIFGTGNFPGQTAYSEPTTGVGVGGATFNLKLTDGNLRNRGEHWGRLEVTDPSDNDKFKEFCTDIKYRVGVQGNCEFAKDAIPPIVPPGYSRTIYFIGHATTDYRLTVLHTGGTDTHFTKTDAGGQGQFPSVPFPGGNGDNVTFRIFVVHSGATCTPLSSKVVAGAPRPTDPGTGPVIPAGVVSLCTPGDDGDCAKAAGADCTYGTSQGVKTALGCIPTDPTELVKAILRFVTAIAGGLAFLLMISGAFQMITSSGNPESLQAGKDRFSSAILGLLFIIFSVLLLKIIGVDILGLREAFGLP